MSAATPVLKRTGRPQKPEDEVLAPVTSWIEKWLLDVIYGRARHGGISTSSYLSSLVKKGLESEGVSLQNKPQTLSRTDV